MCDKHWRAGHRASVYKAPILSHPRVLSGHPSLAGAPQPAPGGLPRHVAPSASTPPWGPLEQGDQGADASLAQGHSLAPGTTAAPESSLQNMPWAQQGRGPVQSPRAWAAGSSGREQAEQKEAGLWTRLRWDPPALGPTGSRGPRSSRTRSVPQHTGLPQQSCGYVRPIPGLPASPDDTVTTAAMVAVTAVPCVPSPRSGPSSKWLNWQLFLLVSKNPRDAIWLWHHLQTAPGSPPPPSTGAPPRAVSRAHRQPAARLLQTENTRPAGDPREQEV